MKLEKKISDKALRVSILIAGISSGASKDLHRLKLTSKRVLKIERILVYAYKVSVI